MSRWFKSVLWIFVSVILIAGAIGCSSDDSSKKKTTPGANDPVPTVAADDAKIQYYGRVDFSDPKAPAFDWPAIYFKAKFTGTKLGFLFEGAACRYNVIIDSNEPEVLVVEGGDTAVYWVETVLAAGEHTVTVEKRHETTDESVVFHGFALEDGTTLLDLSEKPALKIEILGTSSACGYGVESDHRDAETDDDYYIYTNTSLAYGPLIAKHYGAQYMISAVSGTGLVINNNREDPPLWGDYFKYTLLAGAKDASSPEWDLASWTPDLVIINLGLNDLDTYWYDIGNTVPASEADFKAAYTALLDTLRAKYPSTTKYLCVGAYSESGFEGQIDHEYDPAPVEGLLREYVSEIVADQITAGKTDIRYGNYAYQGTGDGWAGLDYHPNAEEQQSIADQITGYIRAVDGESGDNLLIPDPAP